MKMIFPALIMVLLTSTLAMQADEKTASEPMIIVKLPEKVGPVTHGCQLSLSSAKVTYRFGEAIPLRLETKNVNADIAYFGKAGIFNQYRFEVKLPDGKAAPMTLYGKLYHEGPQFGSMIFVELKREMTDADELDAINRTYDMTLEGEYTITAYRQIFIKGDDGQKRHEVPSNELKITISDEPEQQGEQQSDKEVVKD